MKSLKLLVLAFLSMQAQAQAIKPEDIIPDIGEYTIVKAFPCQPPHFKFTAMCLLITKDGKELMSVHDIQSKEALEIRDTKRVLWRKGWVFT